MWDRDLQGGEWQGGHDRGMETKRWWGGAESKQNALYPRMKWPNNKF